MAQGLAHLSKEYVGRGIGYGKDHDGNEIGLYFVTGRSDPSRRRVFKVHEQGPRLLIKVDRVPEDREKELPADHALIYYNAIRITANERIITNGAQTDLVAQFADTLSWSGTDQRPHHLLQAAFHNEHFVTYVKDGQQQRIDLTSFEPDKPNYTTRITAAAFHDEVTLSQLRPSFRGLDHRRTHDWATSSLDPGRLHLVTTYAGPNVADGEVIPRFAVDGIHAPLLGRSIEELADSVYRLLGPKNPGTDIDGDLILKPGKDFRVGVVAFRYNPKNQHYNGVILQKTEAEAPSMKRFSGVAE